MCNIFDDMPLPASADMGQPVDDGKFFGVGAAAGLALSSNCPAAVAGKRASSKKKVVSPHDHITEGMKMLSSTQLQDKCIALKLPSWGSKDEMICRIRLKLGIRNRECGCEVLCC